MSIEKICELPVLALCFAVFTVKANAATTAIDSVSFVVTSPLASGAYFDGSFSAEFSWIPGVESVFSGAGVTYPVTANLRFQYTGVPIHIVSQNAFIQIQDVLTFDRLILRVNDLNTGIQGGLKASDFSQPLLSFLEIQFNTLPTSTFNGGSILQLQSLEVDPNRSAGINYRDLSGGTGGATLFLPSVQFIPEPSTSGLALAGLSLLLIRRGRGGRCGR